MPRDQGTLGVNRKVYIKLSIEPQVQGDEMTWPIPSHLPNPTGKFNECESQYKK